MDLRIRRPRLNTPRSGRTEIWKGHPDQIRARSPINPPDAPWTEEYAGGSAEAERAQFEELAGAMMRLARRTRDRASAHGVPHGLDRALHAKATLAVDHAELRFRDDLPEELCHGFAHRGATYFTTVRFSNAAGTGESDHARDMRGVALRVKVDAATSHDLLMTNFPVSHARDARQFVEFASALTGGRLQRLLGVVRLLRLFGPAEVIRMLRNVSTARRRPIDSVATQIYWSRGAMRWGPTLAVRYLLRPVAQAAPGPVPDPRDPAFLSHEAERRLAGGDILMELCVQRFVDATSTPIEDAAVPWPETVSPPEPVAVLTIHRCDLTTPEAQREAEAIDALAFNPWNTTEEFRPLGNLNRARKSAYDASAAQRSGTRWGADVPLRNRVLGGAARAGFKVVNRVIPWWRLPVRISVLNLEAFRHELRRKNLIDTEPRDVPPRTRAVPVLPAEKSRWARTPDGRDNDLSAPEMGAVGAAFGRNLRAAYDPDGFDRPNPVLVSDQLLARERFLPAKTLNILAACWIQFQVHDWVNHARHPLGEADVRVPMPQGRTWHNTPEGPAEQVMRIGGNKTLEVGPDGTERLFANAASHWWDASEIYGSDDERMREVREGAKIRLDDGYLPQDCDGQELTGFNESWWLGLSGLHTLFAREHNALCDELRAHYRGWSDERTFQTARLIVSALIAKIHTVEWTPAILGTEAIDLGLKTNWHGPPSGDWLTKLGVWLMDTHSSVGIPQTVPDHTGAPYSLTEDFATVYRLHPLIPDDYRLLDSATGELLRKATFNEIRATKADEVLRDTGLDNLLYSFGTAHPGAITLHNFPEALRRFEREGELIDLAVVDLVRTRRRGVPRYNDFRAGLHMPRIRSFDELCTNPESVRRMKELYRDVDDLDTVVGLLAETPPDGFGFSDTAFRIFILMASRRLQSDRFLTVDFREEIYSPLGMDWIEQNTMTSVVLRHCPDLAALMPRGATAFAPWRPVVPPTT
ncbi:peroxidase family protein [Nocardioides sp.]|uniref:peroxidase family protein n=1 Tax=Nocardioides sp. TaxID=35761 RepID=UPI003562BF76